MAEYHYAEIKCIYCGHSFVQRIYDEYEYFMAGITKYYSLCICPMCEGEMYVDNNVTEVIDEETFSATVDRQPLILR